MSDTDLILIVLSTFVTLAYLSSSIIFIRFIITAQQIGFFFGVIVHRLRCARHDSHVLLEHFQYNH